MTEEEIEKQAEEYAFSVYPSNDRRDVQDRNISKLSYKNGARWGMEHTIEWHDLRKNPTDLPKEEKEVLVYLWDSYYIGSYSSEDVEWWFNEFSLDYKRLDEVIAWCELPTYKEK